MDIQHLIDRLERALDDSTRLPLTSSIVVDEDRVYNIIDQMRVAVPEAVKRASRVEAERDRILAQAKEEANRIRELAKQEAAELVNRDTIIANAHARAENILEHAYHESDRLRQDADHYAMHSLTSLQEDLTRSLAIVRNGITKLKAETQPEISEVMPTDAPVVESAEKENAQMVN